jgi:DNA adenine methylase
MKGYGIPVPELEDGIRQIGATRVALEDRIRALDAAPAPAPAAPLVKWVGGKGRLLPELVKRMPATWDRYFEPFAGGAALCFRVAPRGEIVLGDANEDLMITYGAVGWAPEAVIRRLRGMEREHRLGGATFYADVRATWNAERKRWTSARRFTRQTPLKQARLR